MPAKVWNNVISDSTGILKHYVSDYNIQEKLKSLSAFIDGVLFVEYKMLAILHGVYGSEGDDYEHDDLTDLDYYILDEKKHVDFLLRYG